MASRQEEKERRREERLTAERAAAARASRGRRLRLLIGGALALALVAAIVVAVVAGGSDSKKGGPKTAAGGGKSGLPAAKTTDLSAAVRDAGCQLREYTPGPHDRDHVPDSQKVTYRTNPPSYGAHSQAPSSDGDYVGQGSPPPGRAVHSLEHGRIEIQYRPGLPTPQVKQLEGLFNESAGPYEPGQYMLLFQNNTGMKDDVAAVAWARTLTCPHFNPKVFDAFRAFRQKYTLKGPEFINQAE